jgi:hypothetical protein
MRAIEGRLGQGTGGISGKSAEEIGNERKRTEAIGRCEELYRSGGEDVPVGLRSLSLAKAVAMEEKLRKKLGRRRM